MSSPAVQLRQSARPVGSALTRARLTVVPRRRVRAARMPFVTLVSLVLLGGIVGLLCFNTQMQQASFAAASLQTQADSLTAREQTLHEELQELRDPQNLATLAQQAGMVAPESACTLRLADQSATDACVPASAVNTPRLHDAAPVKPRVLNPKPVIVDVVGDPAPQHEGRKKGRNAGRR